jgi:hypothetical protein
MFENNSNKINYDPIQFPDSGIVRRDIAVPSLVGLERGSWITPDGTLAQVTEGGVAYPIWTKPTRTDVQELSQVTVVMGQHLARVENNVGTVIDFTGLAVGDALVADNGVLKALTGAPGEVTVAYVEETDAGAGDTYAIIRTVR